MATKKPAPTKKVAPAKKAAPAKKSAPAAKAVVAKKAAKPAVKAVAQKSAPSKKSAPANVASKKAPAKAAVTTKPVVKPAPKKAAPAKEAPKKAAPAKPVAKPAVKSAPVKEVKPAAKPVPAPKAPVPAKAAKPEAKPATKVAAPKQEAPKKAAKPAPAPKAPVPVKAAKPVKKVPAIAPEIRFAETSKAAASPAEVRKALRAKEAKKDLKPVPMPKINTKSARKYEPEFTRSVLDSKEEPIQTGPTQRYSDAELLEFKELIQNKLNAAKQELAYLNGLITRKDSMSGEDSDTRYMTMEDGSLSMEREQLSQMASRQIDFIEKLEKALMRIENRTYGICRVTGKLIDKARLRAVPHATLSMEAKTGANKPGPSF
jgi:RNA polymerase-binding transcription factor DksA